MGIARMLPGHPRAIQGREKARSNDGGGSEETKDVEGSERRRGLETHRGGHFVLHRDGLTASERRFVGGSVAKLDLHQLLAHPLVVLVGGVRPVNEDVGVASDSKQL